MISVTIAGNVSQDAEVRRTPNGDAVAQWSVASNQGKDKPAIFLRCTLWGKRAESALSTYLTKGTPVTVMGLLTQNKYMDKNGQEKVSYEVKVQEIVLQGGKRDEAPRALQPAPRQQAQKPQGSGFDDMQDDSMIPF